MDDKTIYNLNSFYVNGFCIIDNFLDVDVSKSLLKKFTKIKEWDRVDQVRDHYKKGGPFEMNSTYFPNNDEEYYLQGWRAKKYESSKIWIKFFKKEFLLKISNLFQKKIQRDTTYILKYSKNDFSRIHVDDFAEMLIALI